MDATISAVRQLSVAQAAAIINVVIVIGRFPIDRCPSDVSANNCSTTQLPIASFCSRCWPAQTNHKCCHMVGFDLVTRIYAALTLRKGPSLVV